MKTASAELPKGKNTVMYSTKLGDKCTELYHLGRRFYGRKLDCVATH